MNRILILLLSLFPMLSFAQNKATQEAMEIFTDAYNHDQHEQLFEKFDDNMKEAISLASLKQFLSGSKLSLGNLNSTEFLTYQDEIVAHYKGNFENAALSIFIVQNEEEEIIGLSLEPYTEIKEKDSPKLVNKIKSYPKDIQDKIMAHVQSFPEQTTLAIAMIENGKVNYYGVKIQRNAVHPFENHKGIFSIGSITKVFTATLLANLHTKRRINMNQNINSLYPFPFANDIVLDYKSLANHHSGLSRLPSNLNLDFNQPYKDYKQEDLYNYMEKDMEIKEEKSYEYSNLGPGILGHSLALSQKSTFENLLRKRVLNPYKMKNTFFEWQPYFTKSYDEEGKIMEAWEFDILLPAGGLYSTVEDLSKFALAHFNPKNKALALTREKTASISPSMDIGLAWHIIKREDGSHYYWHNGATNMSSSSMVLDITQEKAVIILSNLSGFHPAMGEIDQLSEELLNK